MSESSHATNDSSAEPASCTLTLVSPSSEQTQLLGERLGALLQGGELLLLDGQLGSGKTTFTQGLAKGLHIATRVSSPTFTLLKEYQGTGSQDQHHTGPTRSLALYHFDLYRLDDPEEIFDLGFEEYFAGSGVCVVEWADKALGLWPTERLELSLHLLPDNARRLHFVAFGAHYCKLLQQFQKQPYVTASS